MDSSWHARFYRARPGWRPRRWPPDACGSTKRARGLSPVTIVLKPGDVLTLGKGGGEILPGGAGALWPGRAARARHAGPGSSTEIIEQFPPVESRLSKLYAIETLAWRKRRAVKHSPDFA